MQSHYGLLIFIKIHLNFDPSVPVSGAFAIYLSTTQALTSIAAAVVMSGNKQEHGGLPFDPVALKAKYRADRDKRLRDNGNERYRIVEGGLRHYLGGPCAEPGCLRPSIDQKVEFGVMGGGYGG